MMKEQLEIERVFLLRSMPELPPGSKRLMIEQGYLSGSDGSRQGRLRRTLYEDGSSIHHRNEKTGSGRVRQEREGEITAEEFAREWADTQGRRIVKARHRVAVGDLVWEIDEFLGFPLFLAEVELPAVTHAVIIPKWLERVMVREVSEDSRYHNYALALQGPPTETVGR